jgi:calcium-dependent protein kinase
MNVGRRLSQFGAKGESSTAGITSLRLLRDPFRDIGHRYEILGDPLARGGFADVFKVRDLSTNQIRAAKRVPKDRISDNSLLRRELEMLLTLDHPNVVRLFEWFEAPDSIWLIQEMCTGGELLSSVGNCSSRDALKIIRQILLGLAYMHDRGVIHRDVKLENCMFQDNVVKIIDFGLAGVLRQTATPPSELANKGKPGTPMSQTGKAGTAIYLSPELLAIPAGKAPKYTPKCDMWALGVMAYILLTSEHPFWDKRTPFVDQDMYMRIMREPVDVSLINPETARDLVSKLLRVDSNERLGAHEALLHPCMRVSAFLGSQGHLRLMTNLRTYKFFGPLQRVVLTVLAYHSKEDDVLREVFSLLDTDMNGVLSKQEIISGMNRLGLLLPPDFDTILDSIDADGSGEIDFTEFVAAGMSADQVRSQQLIDSAFSWFSDGRQFITGADLEKLVSKQEAQDTLMEYAEDLKGIDRESFRKFIEQIAIMKESGDCGTEDTLTRSKSKRRYSSDDLQRSISSPSSSLRRNSDRN